MYLYFNYRGSVRKHFTALMHYLCNHPYLEKYAIPRPLTPQEKADRNNAIGIVVHSVYHVLWSFRCKFFNIRRKGRTEGIRLNVKAPQNAWTADTLMKLEKSMMQALRGISSVRRARQSLGGDEKDADDDGDDQMKEEMEEEVQVITSYFMYYTIKHPISCACYNILFYVHVITSYFMYML